MDKLYNNRMDNRKLDELGDYSCRHLEAMTAEGLFSKADIAAELGWRDYRIDELEKIVTAVAGELGLDHENYQSWSLLLDGMCHRIAELEAQIDSTRLQLNKKELDLEDWECLNVVMDDENVPTANAEGNIYSPVGRYRCAIKTARRDAILDIVDGRILHSALVNYPFSAYSNACKELKAYANTIGEE